MTSWNPVRFRELLQQLRVRTGLTQTELAQLAGRHRTQFNRWTRSENRPEYDPLARLARAIADEHPAAADLARELLTAAGYGDQPATEEHGQDEPALKQPSPAVDRSPPADSEAGAGLVEVDPFHDDVAKIAMYLQQLDEERQEIDRRIEALEARFDRRVEALEAKSDRRIEALEAVVNDLREQLGHKPARSA